MIEFLSQLFKIEMIKIKLVWIMNVLKAYCDCMQYIREAKTSEDFAKFEEKMKPELTLLKRNETRQSYEWVRYALVYHRRLLVDNLACAK